MPKLLSVAGKPEKRPTMRGTYQINGQRALSIDVGRRGCGARTGKTTLCPTPRGPAPGTQPNPRNPIPHPRAGRGLSQTSAARDSRSDEKPPPAAPPRAPSRQPPARRETPPAARPRTASAARGSLAPRRGDRRGGRWGGCGSVGGGVHGLTLLGGQGTGLFIQCGACRTVERSPILILEKNSSKAEIIIWAFTFDPVESLMGPAPFFHTALC